MEKVGIIKEIDRLEKLARAEKQPKKKYKKKVKVEEAGSTDLIGGALVDYKDYKIKLEEIKDRTAAGEEGLVEPKATDIILGITKAALATESFLSAASFQETTKVLTDAAIRGKVDDPLIGLKENVILGKLIPAGSTVALDEEEVQETGEIAGI